MVSSWESISLYESVDLVSKYYENRHGKTPSTGKSKEIVSCLTQGREYFTIAANTSDLVKPVILYYGVLSLSRGIILFLNSDARETTLSNSHGVGAAKWKDMLSKGIQEIPNLPVNIQNGTFLELQNATSNGEFFSIYQDSMFKRVSFGRTTKTLIPVGQELTVKEILQRIPDLLYLYEQTFKEFSKCYLSDILYQNNSDLYVNIFETDLGLSDFEKIRNDLGLPKQLQSNWRNEEKNGKTTKVHTFTLKYENQDQLDSNAPMIQNDLNGRMYFTSLLSGSYRLSSTLSLFLTAYSMSMLARYHPSIWISFTNRNSGDFSYPIMKASIALIQSRFPQLVVQHLQNTL
jgi:hypothetical protein